MKFSHISAVAVILAITTARLLGGDLRDTPERLTIVGSPIMGNVSILWFDLISKMDVKFRALHDPQPTDSEVFNLRHEHADAIFLNRTLGERDVELLGKHPGKLIDLKIGDSVKDGYQVHMFFWEKNGTIDPLIDRFLQVAVSPDGMKVSHSEGKYLKVDTEKIRKFLESRKK